MRYCILFLFLFSISFLFGQTSPTDFDFKYREDQFYTGFSYGLLSKTPVGSKSRGLSGAIQFGFLRDMPINKERNLAIALGAGFNFKRFSQNLFIDKNEMGETIYEILGKEGPVKYKANRLGLSIIELPLELRWRTSSMTNYQFWRVYTGFRLGYVFSSTSIHKRSETNVRIKNIDGIDRLRYSLTLGFGYNKINFFTKYDLNNLFKKDIYAIDGSHVEMTPLEFGFIFYLL